MFVASATSGHRLAMLAFSLACLSGVLALYGSLIGESQLDDSPLSLAQNRSIPDRIPNTLTSQYTIHFFTFLLPVGLGIVASLLGGKAIRVIDQAHGASIGHLLSVFAIMIGGLAAVVAGCMCFSIYVWNHAPKFFA